MLENKPCEAKTTGLHDQTLLAQPHTSHRKQGPLARKDRMIWMINLATSKFVG
jgi:hypothetical protein